MAVGLGIALVCGPLLAILVVAYAIRETPVRSYDSDEFHERPTPLWAALLPIAVGLALFLLGTYGRAEAFYLVLVVLCAAGAGVVERKLLVTVAEITYNYVNPEDWQDGAVPPGPRWRYQMRNRYVHDPEWVDRIFLDLLETHPTYASFTEALANDEFPPGKKYQEVLDQKLWGPVFPSVRNIVKKVIVGEVFADLGPRFKSGKSPEAIYEELRDLHASGDRRTLLDRWQYYWCLRNLNLVEKLMHHVVGARTLLGVMAVGSVGFIAGVAITSSESITADLLLRGVTGGSLLWLLLVCGGASILIVGVFRGTGTFSVAQPTRGLEFDPLWTNVIQVGILAFAVSFVVYGIGSPFLLQPAAIDDFSVDSAFLVYAAGSFLFCFIVFVVHTLGIHNLMRGSRDNALDRASEDLRVRGPQLDDLILDHFKDVRGMRVWPLRSSTVFQIAGGILLPVGAQALLIYTGLS